MSTPEFPQQAYNALIEKIYAPVFLTKLANDFGVIPQNDEEKSQLFELAGILREAREQEVIKTSSANSLITEAADGLKAALNQRGYNHGTDTSQEKQIKAAAYSLANDPVVQEAALQYGAYMAQLQEQASQN